MTSTRPALRNLERLRSVIEPILRAARIPGAAIAVVAGGETVWSGAFGWRDMAANKPMHGDTLYPIASTSKAMNATLLGMLVDEGRLAWDAPVGRYLPGFALQDPIATAQVTLRDLITMRTGLPRHDWLWMGSSISRSELVNRLRHLDAAAGFRERFQYNNLTVTAAGHVAEVVAGRTWEELVDERIVRPLGLVQTVFTRPQTENLALSYHENGRRELRPTQPLASEVTAPSGGAIYSTVQDMARWLQFNLRRGCADGCQLIDPLTLAEIHSPQVVMGNGRGARKPGATYAMGWSVDAYNGHLRLSHGGYLHDVHSEAALFPRDDIGIVSFVNFGPPMLALFINECVFDALMGLRTPHSLDEKLRQYEAKVAGICARDAAQRRVSGTTPSHYIEDYAGTYVHPAYGALAIRHDGRELIFAYNSLELPLEHWHYDSWSFKESDRFEIHEAHPFDRAGRVSFDTDMHGRIMSVRIRLEPAAAPIRFAISAREQE